MKYWLAGLTAFVASWMVAAPGHATIGQSPPVCNFRVAMAMGVNCPIRPGSIACLTVNASIGPCEDRVQCFGGPGFFCSATLIPISGPEKQCAFSSRRPTGFRCFAPGRLIATRTPTPPSEDTPTLTFTPTDTPESTPPTATNTPEVTDTPVATATDTAQVTDTPVSTPTDTVPAPTATDTPLAPTATATGTATGTTAAALVLRF